MFHVEHSRKHRKILTERRVSMIVKIGESEIKGGDLSRIICLVLGICTLISSVTLIVKWFTDSESFKFSE